MERTCKSHWEANTGITRVQFTKAMHAARDDRLKFIFVWSVQRVS